MIQINLLNILTDLPLKERIQRIIAGIKGPKDSGEYKYAQYALLRIFGPASMAILGTTTMFLLVMLVNLTSHTPYKAAEYTVTMVEPEKIDTKELKIEEEKQKEPEKEKEIIIDNPDLAPGPPSPIQTAGPTQEFSSNPNPTDDNTAGVGGDLDVPVVPYAVVMTKSPVVIKGLYGNRTKGGRERALSGYGGPGGGSKGRFPTEDAVLRALRWLKKYQESDGSWTSASGDTGKTGSYLAAHTGFALLCYLAHGETPVSEEFGPTVERAIRWLVENQTPDGRFKSMDAHQYSLPIAAYALSEAYGMTKVPTLKEAAEKSIDIIIKGQHASGGWDYSCAPGTRDDSSYMAWCAQALKAGKIAGLENPGLEEACKKAIMGFKKNAGPSGGFGYISPGNTGLTAAGVLCMQLLGASKEGECRRGLEVMKEWTCDWDKPMPGATIYYWYYATQAKFQEGGEAWKDWNKQFANALTKNQVIVKGGGVDGKDIGYWEMLPPANAHRTGRLYDTALSCLQLEVYYRYLPTFKVVEAVAVAEPVVNNKASELDITITVPR